MTEELLDNEQTGAVGSAIEPTRVLVADDAPNIRLGVSRMLEKWGYEVHSAADGDEAWAVLEKEPIQLVISDWMMPGCNGPELCRRVRDKASDHYTYFILLTARDEKDALVEGMEAGADDYLVKPFNQGELKVRIKAGERILRLEHDLAQKNEELWQVHTDLKSAYDVIEADLKVAAQMQLALLPSTRDIAPSLNFEWLFIPSTFVGGDILNFRMVDENQVVLYALDVSGHGVQAAMLSESICRILNSDDFCIREGHLVGSSALCPARIVEALNKQFQTGSDDSRYFTIALAVFDVRSGLGSLCQAGHPHPLLVRKSGEVCEVGEGGMPVGMLPNMRYDSVDIELNSGDRLYLYSDGITECEDSAAEQFGTERFGQFLAENIGSSLLDGMGELQKVVTKWQGTDHFDDDVSVLALERLFEN